MRNDFYVGISGQLALSRRLETIAHNVANAETIGFRAEEVRFSTALSEAEGGSVSFAKMGGTHLSRSAGAFTQTGNPLDVAIEGDAWLATATDIGTVYTRDGRIKVAATGELQTLAGAAILDAGGTPIVIDQSAGPVLIGRDGRLSQNERIVGALGLFKIAGEARLERYENAGVVPDSPVEPIVEFTDVGLISGYVERSNVNAVKEITKLVAVQRSFDAVTSALNLADGIYDAALRDLSGVR